MDIRAGRAPEVLMRMRENNLDRIHPHEQTRDDHRARRRIAEGHRDEAWRQVWHEEKWASAFIILTVALTAVWLLLFLLQRTMDVQIMEALGYGPSLAPVMGTVIALAFGVAGVLVTGLLGLHAVLPARLKVRRSAQLTVAFLIIAFAISLMFILRDIAVYRSEYTFGPQISVLGKTLAEEQASGADRVAIAVTGRDLADAQVRLATGVQLDRTLTVLVPPLEMALSAFPLFAGELAMAGFFAFLARRATIGERRAERQIEAVTRQDRSDAVDLLTKAGVTVADLHRYLAELNAPAPELPRPHDPSHGSRSEPTPQAAGGAETAAPQDGGPDESSTGPSPWQIA